MTVTFFGHSQIAGEKIPFIENSLRNHIEVLICQGAEEFLLGGYGKFDYICAKILTEFKNKYSEINRVLVIPYLDRKYDNRLYDSSWYPPLETVPKRFAISRRNEYMVNKADTVVCYIDHSWGGASKSVEYAKRKNKSIIFI